MRLADPPPLLAGREEVLADLRTRLTGSGAGPRTVALYGMGGAGKTSVALAYAHRHLAEAGVAWQLEAEDPAVLAAGFAELAAQLGARDVADTRDPVASVHAVLAAFPGRWLLIFDNAPDRASVAPFVPPAGPGQVLITSQNALWPPGQGLDVTVLDPQAATDFLTARTGDPDWQAAQDLAGELGGLPLALEQAGAYIQAAAITVATYLALLRERRAELLARGQTAGHPADVAATIGLALSRLTGEAPAAAGLLRLLAFLAPEPVPLTLLLADTRAAGELAPAVAALIGPLLGDPVAAGDAGAALRRYSLITPAAGGLVLVHRLVQLIICDHLPADEAGQWQHAAATLAEEAIPADPQEPAAWPAYAVLLPHARAVLDLTSEGIWRTAIYLGWSGSYPAARDLFSLIADAGAGSDAYGPEHPGTLDARAWLAYWTGMAGDAAAARDQFAALLPIRERVLGAEHPDTLATRAELARWTGQAGDVAAARDQYAALLPISERVLGAEHPDTLATRLLLARSIGQAGDAAAARDQHAALLPIVERVLGAEHLDTLATRFDLARSIGQAADVAAARDQVAVLLPIVERVLGAEHPDTLTIRVELAGLTGAAGDAAAARDQHAAVLPIRERVLGAEHPDTLITRGSVAYWTGMAGDAAAARDQYAAALPISERVLGAEHPNALIIRANLADLTGEAGDAAAARDQYAALLPIRERVLGSEHPDTLTTRANLADWTGQAERSSGGRRARRWRPSRR